MSKPEEGLLRRAWSRLKFSVAEALVSLAMLGGWLFLTAAIVHLTAPVAWLFSLGLLGFCLAGLKFTARLFWEGLYALTREVKRGP
jgi:hypothetical protein